MNRLAKLIASLNAEDLRLIQKDLDAGNIHRLISQRLAEFEHRKICATCGRELPHGDHKFVIEFGPKDLRQRAFFDEYDCLQYFIDTRLQEKHEH